MNPAFLFGTAFNIAYWHRKYHSGITFLSFAIFSYSNSCQERRRLAKGRICNVITKEMIGATSFSFPSFGGGSNGEETFHPFHSFALGHYARQREGKGRDVSYDDRATLRWRGRLAVTKDLTSSSKFSGSLGHLSVQWILMKDAERLVNRRSLSLSFWMQRLTRSLSRLETQDIKTLPSSPNHWI